MDTLKTELSQGGFTLKQVERNGDCAIYVQINGGVTTSYEVIRIQKEKAREVFGKSYPDREVYPGNEAWGKNGWTCITLERAKARFAGLTP